MNKVITCFGERRLEHELQQIIDACRPDHLHVLVDETTLRMCWPVVESFERLRGVQPIVIAAGDTHKSVESLSHVWSQLQRQGATRHSLLVNLGGGMVTDLGGFAASTFKRGIRYVNIPTTLLAMVDASVGGKTGVNFGGLKNEIGVFNDAEVVLLDTTFLRTLDHANILSGYAEMLKHGLIDDEAHWARLLDFDLDVTSETFADALEKSVAVKQRIVLEDPMEHGIRKALNLGHTVGHAFESLALSDLARWSCRPGAEADDDVILHGYAVAWGLVCELYLSVVKTGFPVDKMRRTVRFVFDHYGRMPITCDDYPVLLELMTHDKKNTAGRINFTLLGDVGDVRVNQTATPREIEEALDFYREGQ